MIATDDDGWVLQHDCSRVNAWMSAMVEFQQSECLGMSAAEVCHVHTTRSSKNVEQWMSLWRTWDFYESVPRATRRGVRRSAPAPARRGPCRPRRAAHRRRVRGRAAAPHSAASLGSRAETLTAGDHPTSFVSTKEYRSKTDLTCIEKTHTNVTCNNCQAKYDDSKCKTTDLKLWLCIALK